MAVMGLLLAMVPAVRAGSLDSIPMDPSERVVLYQSFTISSSGSASNLHLPTRSLVSFDVSVESGKRLLLMVITDEQYQAVSAGEQAQGPPMLRTIVSGVDTEAVVLDPGDYTVALIAQDGQPYTQAAMRARARAY